jgi:hypothetical protein
MLIPVAGTPPCGAIARIELTESRNMKVNVEELLDIVDPLF